MSDQDDTGTAAGQVPEEPEGEGKPLEFTLEDRVEQLEGSVKVLMDAVNRLTFTAQTPPVIPGPSPYISQDASAYPRPRSTDDQIRATARALVADEVIGRLKRAISAFMADPEEEQKRVVPKDEKFSGA